jgi:hypothetical protein
MSMTRIHDTPYDPDPTFSLSLYLPSTRTKSMTQMKTMNDNKVQMMVVGMDNSSEEQTVMT